MDLANEDGQYLPAGEPDIGILISCIRAGSSLGGHLLHAAGHGNCIGELHQKWDIWDESTPQRVRTVYELNKRKARIKENASGVIIDKQVGPNVVLNGPTAYGWASKIWIQTREPLCHIHAVSKWQWPQCNFIFLLRQYANQVAAYHLWKDSRDVTVYDYYDLYDPAARADLLGDDFKDEVKYKPTAFAGRPGWGDPTEALKKGTLLPRSRESDIQKALDNLDPGILTHPAVPQLYGLYNELHRAAGRQTVEIPV